MADSPQPSYPRRASRHSLRVATFIDPQTGSRLNKTFTLHDVHVQPQNGDFGEETEATPLLTDGASDLPTTSKPQEDASSTTIVQKVEQAFKALVDFAVSDLGKGVFKSALAYLLGSLFTFIPALGGLFGKTDTKHLVATVTVYFHPARSFGSMLEALIIAWTAFLYTTVVSTVSMGIATFFTDTVEKSIIGQVIVLILFVGGGLGFIAWVKLRKGDPLVNIGCSLASLTLITILTKEGAVQDGDYSFAKISQILRMLLAGIIATSLVSFLIFPISARRKVRQNMVEITDALSDMLALITSSFISGNEAELHDEVLAKVTERHQKLVSSLPQNLKESKYEHYVLGTEKQAHFEKNLASCLQRLSQSIGGLRSAAAMQFEVIKQPNTASDGFATRDTTPFGSLNLSRNFSLSSPPGRGPLSPTSLSRIDEVAPDENLPKQRFRTPSQIFDLFLDNLGGSMRSLAYTMKEILDDLQLTTDQDYGVEINPRFKVSLERALELYQDARLQALDAVYDKKDMDRRRPLDVEADWEEAAACCGHFSFSLLEVAEDTKHFLAIMDDMQAEKEQQSGRSWSWLRFWVKKETQNSHPADDEVADLTAKAKDLEVQLSHRKMPDARKVDPESSSWQQTKQKYFRQLYDSFFFFRRDDIKFAIKVSIGAMIFALPSFIPGTLRNFYSHWRGEWGLVSYMLVCSMTIGASNTTGVQRIWGTCLGALLAIVAWHVSWHRTDPSPVVLGLCGFMMAYWTAYIMLGMGKGPLGRFIMLTYNLSALYAYSLAMQEDEDDGDEEDDNHNPLIFNIAGHRTVAVISGCIWGLFITRLVWPISARERLKESLSLLWLRMSLIWKRDPLAVLVEGEHQHQYMNLREEFELQRYMARLQTLIESSKNEFELKGPFPHKTYTQIIKSTAQMLDAFHAMNLVILKDLKATPGEEVLLQATAEERYQLCIRISHMFTVLASSMKLEYPLSTDALPKIDHVRDRLLARIFTYRKANAEDMKTSDEDFGILYTYALVTGQLAQEIQAVLKQVEALFGTLDEEALMLQ
jgi:uncharacterized membrane protein YccC